MVGVQRSSRCLGTRNMRAARLFFCRQKNAASESFPAPRLVHFIHRIDVYMWINVVDKKAVWESFTPIRLFHAHFIFSCAFR